MVGNVDFSEFEAGVKSITPSITYAQLKQLFARYREVVELVLMLTHCPQC